MENIESQILEIFNNLPAGGYATEKIAEEISRRGRPYDRARVESALYGLADKGELSLIHDDLGFVPADFFSKA